MNSQTLREARKYEEAMEQLVEREERPAFHLSARTGWMNDPNGLSYYNGRFHLFYQYHPYVTHWGPMHWGHAVTEDFLHWTYLPAALAPDSWYDKDGCFSGNALTLPDGRQLLMYTGVLQVIGEDGMNREVQTQCLAVGDGEDYEKVPQNPVLTEADLPAGSSRFDFRDPKLWQTRDGSYRCVAGNRAADGSGQILLFGSEDGFHWQFRKVLARNRNRFGKMWECPDFFSLNGKQVLLVSPQDMLPRDFEYHNGNGTLCLLGSYDEESETFTEESDQAIDYGIDFYAPQTILTPDGRRVMIGWMQNWDTCNLRANHEKWYGQMSLPRELSVRDGRLCQWPVREIETLRGRQVSYEDLELTGERILAGIEGRQADISISLRPKEGEALYRKFAMRFAQNGSFWTSFSFHPSDAILKVDRKFSGARRAIIHQRRSKIIGGESGEIRIRLILDRYSAELFINDGAQVMSLTFYTPLEANGISFETDGTAVMDIDFFELNRED